MFLWKNWINCRAIPKKQFANSLRNGIIIKLALGRMGSAESVGPLVAALKDQAYSVRSVAAEALGRTGSTESVRPLSMAIKDHD